MSAMTGGDTVTDCDGGQGFLQERLLPSRELKLRRNTAIVLWMTAWATGLSQQISPIGVHTELNTYLLLTIGNLVPPALIAIFYRICSPATFIKTENYLLTWAWVLIGINISVAGGASSPYAMMWGTAFGFFFGAYFMAPVRQLIFHAVGGTLSMLAPIAYDWDAARDGGFLPLALISGVIYLTMATVIVFRRRQMRSAEVDARKLALTDPLTGVANLRAIEEFAEELGDDEYGVIMADLDGLKAANTAYGHAGGDDMIIRAAQLLCAASGPHDQVARVGGDEFVVLMPGAGVADIDDWQDRFATVVSAHNDFVRGSRPQISASTGGAVNGADGTELESLMSAADARMYEHKSATAKITYATDPIETGGGHRIAEHQTCRRRADWTAAVSGLNWLAAAVLVGGATLLPGFDAAVRPEALLLSAGCLVMAVWCGIGELYFRELERKVSDVVVVASVMTGIYFTGGSESPAIALMILPVSYFAGFREWREARVRIGATIVSFSVGFWAMPGEIVAAQARFTFVVTAAFVIAFILQYNGKKLREQHARVQELSELDALTGVPNRRIFEHGMREAIDAVAAATAAGKLPGERPALILIDLDDFKYVNTTLGHKGGDQLLRTVANATRDAVAGQGIVCRIGGDEFAVVLNSARADQVCDVAERCREAVAELGDRPAGEFCGIDVSVSVGFALWRERHDLRGLIADADIALQRSKDSGKNLVSAPPPLRIAG